MKQKAIVTINDMENLVIILQFQNVSFTILKKENIKYAHIQYLFVLFIALIASSFFCSLKDDFQYVILFLIK